MANAVDPTIEQRIAIHLMELAVLRRTTTYEELATLFHLPTEWPQLGSTLSPILYNVYDWCRTKLLPKLTILVVRKSGADMGLPGQGFWAAGGHNNLDRAGKVLLTELWTAEVYDYFAIEATH